MKLAELKNFDLGDLNNLGSAPTIIRLLVALLVLAAVLGLGYYFDTSNQLASLHSAEKKEQQLRKTFETKYAQSANLEAFKAQLAEMELEFGTMIRQLPSQTEIPGVVVDISQTGLASGLNIQLFKPQDETKKGFYAEKPILIRLTGQYEQMAQFSSDIAALPRIVTLHDLEIQPSGDSKPGNNPSLVMSVVAKTYRYLDDAETAALIESQVENKKPKKRAEK